MVGDDFKSLAELDLQVAWKNKSSRSRIKGKKLMEHTRRMCLLKPDAVCTIAPALAAYSKMCISMTKWMIVRNSGSAEFILELQSSLYSDSV
jgi:hypothetical protein